MRAVWFLIGSFIKRLNFNEIYARLWLSTGRQSFPLWGLAEPCAMRMTEGPIWDLGCHRRILREVKRKLRPEGCEGTGYGKRKVERIQARGNGLVESPEGKGIGVSKKWKEGQCIWRAVCLECSEKSRGWTREGGGESWKRRWYTLPVWWVAGRCLDLTLCTREITDSFKGANDKTWFVL